MKKYSSYFLTSLLVVVLCAKVSFAAEIPSQAFSINNATVGVTTLDEIQKTYGIAKPSRVSRDDEADITVCYVSSSAKGKSFLVFESGVMGSFKHITGFRISALLPSGNCAPTKTDIGTLTTGNEVRLGQSLIDFKKSFPVEFRRRGSELTYETESQRTATQEELKRLRTNQPKETQDYFDVTITVKAKFKRNRLVDLYVHKIESY